MKHAKNQILGLIAFMLLAAGFTAAAQSLDSVSQETEIKQEIKDFVSFCSNGGTPR
jgi:hypothetical protein